MTSERDDERAEDAREQAGERSLRPDIQAGAIQMTEPGERVEHEEPSRRRRADELETNSDGESRSS